MAELQKVLDEIREKSRAVLEEKKRSVEQAIESRLEADGKPYAEYLEKLRQKTVTPHGYGIGLLNIEKRLEFAFGKEAGLELYNEDGMATARITIPCRVS